MRVEGIVQGVGFRPFVHRLATSLGLAGFVRNDADGVTLEVEGSPSAVDEFLRRFPRELPPLASIETSDAKDLAPLGDTDFSIRDSEHGRKPTAHVTPDAATCDDCLREMWDPADRRHRYPFINCTNCGPRFTIVRGIPYDRPWTTMADFRMCDPCRAEYEDPTDRRFHAQPNACPDCGPRAWIESAAGDAADPVITVIEGELPRRDAVAHAAALLADGAIVAVKGLGGFHLACDATDEAAVARLRGRKHREDKPFAVMVPDLAVARRLAGVDDVEGDLLAGKERPIVLLRQRPDTGIARSVAPGFHELGLMLPYTPLHHLLLADAGRPLVMTSGNVSDEPIAFRDDDARERLRGIADAFLFHDRPIHTRTDDSVARVVSVAGECQPLLLRRSRGYVPLSLPLPVPTPRPLLAVGAHLKNTFTVATGRHARPSHHVGDLENFETLRSFEQGIEHFGTLFEIEPEVVVRDLHPDYLSTKYAREGPSTLATGRRRIGPGGPPDVIGVQHHHAHLAACLAEHGRTGPAVGAIFDGTGFGPDGSVWGGEILVGDLVDFDRPACLWPVRLPGGAAAIREPWRMACAWLCALEDGAPEPPEPPAALAADVDPAAWAATVALVRSGLRSPVTTSAGRLFDAVSALCGVRSSCNYEGQAAIELEILAAGTSDAAPLPPVPLRRMDDGPDRIDVRPLVAAIRSGAAVGESPARLARGFHLSLAGATAEACRRAADAAGCATVVLSGGVFQNRLLLEATVERLAGLGVTDVLVPRRVPPNDGGISYGQAAIAAARLAREA